MHENADCFDLIHKPIKTKADISYLLGVHKNLIYWCLGKMNKLYDQDAESAAWEALWDAIATYDVYSSVAFSTYAVRVIKNRIGDVIRKQIKLSMKEFATHDEVEAVDTGCRIHDGFEAKEQLDKVVKAVDEYIEMKTGIARNVLIVWRAANFDITSTMIAKICRTSTSRVSETLTSARAFIATRLRD